MRKQNRHGFTLVELMVVIVIILVIAGLVFAVFKGNSTDKMRSSARIAQSAFLGAKDRALHAKELRGIRLTRDSTDSNLANAIVYLQPLPELRTGNLAGSPPLNNVSVSVPTGGSGPTLVTILPNPGDSWFAQDVSGIWPPGQMQVRIPSSKATSPGPWVQLQPQSASLPYWCTKDSSGNLNLFLQVPLQSGAFPMTDTNASIDIQLGNDILPFHQPIQLSSGCVFDLKYSSGNVRSLAGIGTGVNYYIDIMFSPRGGVYGPLSGGGPLHFLIRDIRDATTGIDPTSVAQSQNAQGDVLILTVFPQTGLVQVFEVDPTDVKDNLTGNAGADGILDDIFNFAKQGKSAGR